MAKRSPAPKKKIQARRDGGGLSKYMKMRTAVFWLIVIALIVIVVALVILLIPRKYGGDDPANYPPTTGTPTPSTDAPTATPGPAPGTGPIKTGTLKSSDATFFADVQRIDEFARTLRVTMKSDGSASATQGFVGLFESDAADPYKSASSRAYEPVSGLMSVHTALSEYHGSLNYASPTPFDGQMHTYVSDFTMNGWGAQAKNSDTGDVLQPLTYWSGRQFVEDFKKYAKAIKGVSVEIEVGGPEVADPLPPRETQSPPSASDVLSQAMLELIVGFGVLLLLIGALVVYVSIPEIKAMFREWGAPPEKPEKPSKFQEDNKQSTKPDRLVQNQRRADDRAEAIEESESSVDSREGGI